LGWGRYSILSVGTCYIDVNRLKKFPQIEFLATKGWRGELLLRTLIRRLYGVHRRSGVERGLDVKDLASAYVLRPLGWLS
jgi:hypothetical protein